jgi:mono/diheme cytochrome c family protein
VEFKIHDLMAGTGLIEDFSVLEPLGPPNDGLSFELDLLVAYMLSLEAPTSPYSFDDAVIELGRQTFEDQGCADCHAGAAGTDLQSHDVGTGNPEVEQYGLTFDTPSLRYLWLSAPYFHDGSAGSLRSVLVMPGEHNLLEDAPMEDIEALIAYLLTWS